MNMRSSLSQQDSKIRRLRPRGPDLSTTSNITYSSIKQQLHHTAAAAAATTTTSSTQHTNSMKQIENYITPLLQLLLLLQHLAHSMPTA